MATSCLIDDYVVNKRSSLLFSEQQFKSVSDKWKATDPLLVELQHWDAFKDRDTWNKLDPVHFKMLILTVLSARDNKLKPSQYFDDSQSLVQSLYFLLMGLAYSIQLRTGAAVDQMRVMRLTQNELSFEFNISMISDRKSLMTLPAPEKAGLKIIVDNTFDKK
jgi:hypothetical protein